MDVRIQNTMYQEKERLFKQYKTSMTSPVRVVLNHESLLPIQFKAPFYPVRLKNAYLYTKYTEVLDIHVLQGQITLIYIIYRYFQDESRLSCCICTMSESFKYFIRSVKWNFFS